MTKKDLIQRILDNANEFIDAWPDGYLSCIEQIRNDAEELQYKDMTQD